MKIDKLLKRYRIEHGKHFNLKDHDPADTHGLGSELKPQAKELLADGIKELSHDYLWRTTNRLPKRGHIGIFNRSYYEEVLVVRVHPQILGNEKLPKPLVTKHVWRERFEDIHDFERYLTRNGIAVVKFFLHLSKKEQKRRFLERLDTPDKNWKFSLSDVK